MKCLLTLELYKITATEIGKLKDQQHKAQHVFKFLPQLCLDPKDKLRDSEAWLQFIDQGEEIFYMFNILHIDQPLQEEFNNSGIDLFEEFNFNFLKKMNRHYSYDEMFKSIPLPIHLAFDLNYIGDEWDADLDLNFLGYLDKDLNLVALPN